MTVTVSGVLQDPTGVPVANTDVSFARKDSRIVGQSGAAVAPAVTTVTTASDGSLSVVLEPGNYLLAVTIDGRRVVGDVTVPTGVTSVALADALEQSPENIIIARDEALAARDEAIAARDTAVAAKDTAVSTVNSIQSMVLPASTWAAGVDPTEALISPSKLSGAIAALGGGGSGGGGSTTSRVTLVQDIDLTGVQMISVPLTDPSHLSVTIMLIGVACSTSSPVRFSFSTDGGATDYSQHVQESIRTDAGGIVREGVSATSYAVLQSQWVTYSNGTFNGRLVIYGLGGSAEMPFARTDTFAFAGNRWRWSHGVASTRYPVAINHVRIYPSQANFSAGRALVYQEVI